MNKWLSIQALRGLAALGVVMFHATSIEQKYSGGDILLPGFLRLGQSGVDLFFVISGFIMVTVTRGRFVRGRESLRFLWGRLTRIYPTYWFYFFLTLAVFWVRPRWVNSAQGNQADLLESFLLWPSGRLPLVMVAWSLTHELWFYLVFAVALRFKERLLLPFLLLWGTVIIAVNMFVTTAGWPPGMRIVLHPYSLEFIIGALVALFIYHGRTDVFSSRKAFLVILLTLAGGLGFVYAHDVLHSAGLERVGIIGILYGLLVLSLAASEKAGRLAAPRAMQFLGDISYTVYLSHVLVLSVVGRLWMMNPVPDRLYDNLLAFLMMLAAAIGYGWAGYRLVEQPALAVSHRLRARWFDPEPDGAPVATAMTNPAR
jgi:exopolysaccharide production protein ExoZ